MNPFTNPYIVGSVFIAVGLSGLIRKNYKGRPSILENIIKYSGRTEKILKSASCILLIIAGILIIVFQGLLA